MHLYNGMPTNLATNSIGFFIGGRYHVYNFAFSLETAKKAFSYLSELVINQNDFVQS